MEINIRRATIQALATTKTLHTEIERIYNNRPTIYYKAYRSKENGFYGDIFFEYYSFKHFEILEKVCGIVEHGYDTSNFLEIRRLIKIGFPKIYKLVTTKSKIKHTELQEAVLNNGNFNETSELELNNNYVIFCYLLNLESITNSRKIQVEALDVLYSYIAQFAEFQTKSLAEFYAAQKNLDDSIRTSIFKHRDLSEITEQNLIQHLIEKQNFELFLDSIIDKEIAAKYFNNDLNNFYHAIPRVAETARSQIFKAGGHSSYIGFLSSLLKSYGIFENFFLEDVSETDIQIIDTLFKSIYKNNNVNQIMDGDSAIITMTILVRLSKEIQHLRKAALKSTPEYVNFETERKLHSLQKESDEKTHALEEEVKLLKQELNLAKENNKKIEHEHKKLSSQHSKLIDKNRSMESDIVEAKRLKEFVFNTDNLSDDTDAQVTTSNKELEKATTTLNDLNIVVVGGHDSWVDKMKKNFPHFSFFTPEAASNRAIKTLKYDYIVFNVNKNSHGAYYRLQSLLDKDKILYANAVNTERTILSLYQQLIK